MNSPERPARKVFPRVIPVVLPKAQEPMVQTMARSYGRAETPEREEEDGLRKAPQAENTGIQLKWLIRETLALSDCARGERPNQVCRECGQRCTSCKRLCVHMRQHWTNLFCTCGEASHWRDRIVKHQVRSYESGKGCRSGIVYEVNAPSFNRRREVMGTHAGDDVCPVSGFTPGGKWSPR